jgi:hypothetical protein
MGKELLRCVIIAVPGGLIRLTPRSDRWEQSWEEVVEFTDSELRKNYPDPEEEFELYWFQVGDPGPWILVVVPENEDLLQPRNPAPAAPAAPEKSKEKGISHLSDYIGDFSKAAARL